MTQPAASHLAMPGLAIAEDAINKDDTMGVRHGRVSKGHVL
jgi:hypothetical protein